MVILRKPPDTITQSPCQGKSLFMAWYSETLSQVTSHPALPTAEHFLHTKNYGRFAAAAAKSLQSCPTLCDPRDGSPPGSAIPGILQVRTLEWVAIFFSNAWKWKVKVKSLSRVWLLATPWTAAYQAPPSMGFPRQDYWSRVPLPSLMGGLTVYKIIWWLRQ